MLGQSGRLPAELDDAPARDRDKGGPHGGGTGLSAARKQGDDERCGFPTPRTARAHG